MADLSTKKQGVDLIILYTDQDFEEHREALVYFKDLCVEENMVMLIIGDKPAFDLVHHYIPKEDIAFEVTRPLDMASLMEKVATATDDEFEIQRRKCILIVDDDAHKVNLSYNLRASKNVTKIKEGDRLCAVCSINGKRYNNTIKTDVVAKDIVIRKEN